MAKLNIVVYLVSDWDGFHRRPMLEAFARNAEGVADILCLNPPITPWVAALFRLRRFWHWLRHPGVHQLTSNMFIYTPVVWVHRRIAEATGTLAMWRRRLARQVQRVMARMGLAQGKRVAWVFRPEQHHWLGLVEEEFILYECYDEYSLDYATGNPVPRSVADEAVLLSQADLVFSTSPSLYEARKERHPKVFLVPNGVDWELFSQAAEESTPAAELENIPRPIIGYGGQLSNYVDTEVLFHISEQRPQWSIVLLGDIGVGFLQKKLQSLPNVYFLGGKPRQSMPYYSKGFDVAILPLKHNPYLEASDPLTLWEQLAAGNVVVATDLKEIRKLEDVILLADTPEQFVERIEQGLAGDNGNRIQRGMAIAKERSWITITKRALDILLEETAN